MKNLTQPPKDIPPDRLFRMCLEVHRPVISLDYRIPAAPKRALAVEAISSRELLDLLQRPDASVALIARCLLVGRERAFQDSSRAATALDERTARDASTAILAALERLPLSGMCDHDAWREVLLDGARHPVNSGVALHLGGCVDLMQETIPKDERTNILRLNITERPDRFFGLPLGQLIDCHWHAYGAARAYRESIIK